MAVTPADKINQSEVIKKQNSECVCFSAFQHKLGSAISHGLLVHP